MLLDIFVTVPSLLMTTIAWYIRGGLVPHRAVRARDRRYQRVQGPCRG
jgi:hypothetical protein